MSRIILIGGPPRSGKTTLAQRITKETGIPWISTDAFDDIVQRYLPDDKRAELFPKTILRKKSGGGNDELYDTCSVEEVVIAYLKQAESVHLAVETFVDCALKEGWDYVIEGYHITPKLLSKLRASGHNFNSVVLISTDAKGVIERSLGSDATNDWLRDKTLKEETYVRIAEMVSLFSQKIDQEARNLGMETVETSHDFQGQIDKSFNALVSS